MVGCLVSALVGCFADVVDGGNGGGVVADIAAAAAVFAVAGIAAAAAVDDDVVVVAERFGLDLGAAEWSLLDLNSLVR